MNIKLKGQRVAHGYTQKQLSDLLGMELSTYNRKELGIKDFTLTEIQELMYILDCEFNDIFFKKDVANKCEQ